MNTYEINVINAYSPSNDKLIKDLTLLFESDSDNDTLHTYITSTPVKLANRQVGTLEKATV